MRLSLLLSGIYLTTAVVAGGYQGALERVLLYYAYQIDGLNNPDVRLLGFRCSSWDDETGQCRNDKWDEYRCTAFDDPNKAGGKRCNFWQLMTNLGDTRGGNDAELLMPKGTGVNEKKLPIEKSAVSFYHYTREYMHYVNDDGTREKGRVGNYNPYRFLKYGGTDYNDYLDQLGDIVQHTAKSKKNEGNKWLFAEFESTVKQIKTARIGDHGRQVVKAYEDDRTMDNKYMVTDRELGPNPATKSEYKDVDWYDEHRRPWIEFKWAETQLEMENNKVSNAKDKMDAFRANYDRDSVARDHLAVIKDFENMENKVTKCK